MEQTELEFSHLDVVAIATAAAQLDPRLTTADVLETFCALLAPEPAWYARSVFGTALRLFERHQHRFAYYFPKFADRHLLALQAAVKTLNGDKWVKRPHLLTEPPAGANAFKGVCLGSAPLYSAVGLVTDEQPEAFGVVLVECVAEGMAHTGRICSPSQYLLALTLGSTPIPRGIRRLQGGERALRWLSNNNPTELLHALSDRLKPGGITDRVLQRPPALHDARRRLNGTDAPRVEEMERFLTMVVLGQKPSQKTGHSGGLGRSLDRGLSSKGVYEFIGPQLVATGGRDFVDDNP